LSNQSVLSQFADHRETSDSLREAASFVLKRLASMRFLDLSPDAMKLPSLPGQVILGDRGENLSSVLQAICRDESSKRAIAGWISELTPLDVVDFEFVPDQTGRILVTLVESNGQKTSAYSASDGTLRFLAMIAAVLGPDAAKFYFLEEIDNGIHPTRLHLLLQLIEQNASQGKVQVVATSHSPQFLAMLSQSAREHAALVYRVGDTPEARIRSILDIPEARRVLQQQNLARLQESGWLENAVAFCEEGLDGAEAKP
jgi:predicted ATPase